MRYDDVLSGLFPMVFTESEYVEATHRALLPHGFTPDNTIAIVDVCRDEISQPIMHLVKDQWGEAFNLCSLAGMFFAGRTALAAAMHHAPRPDGLERVLFVSLAHVAVAGDGRIGVCERPGLGPSNACGALGVFLKELQGGRLNVSLDEADLEQSLLKMRLLRELRYGEIPDLLSLTRLVQKVALADLETALRPLTDPKKCNFAVLSGIQIHGPDGNHVCPSTCYAVVGGDRHEFTLVGSTGG